MPYFKVAPAGVFNLWSSWLHPIDDEIVSPDDLDIKRIISHLHDLCGRDDKGTLYYVKYLASMIQRPTEKRPTIVFYSEKQGNGKSWWISFMTDYVLGEANVLSTSNPSVVLEHFNALAANQLLTVFEEARPVGDHGPKSILTNQMFKDMQTNKRLPITGKGKDSKKGFNISCYHILTNFLAALLLEATDRRTVLYKCNCEHVGDRAYFDAMRAQLEKPEVGKKWLNFLAQMDLTGFDAWALPESEIQDKVKKRSMNVVLEHIKAIVEGERTITIPAGGQAFGIKTLYADFKLYCDEIGIQKTYTKGQKAYKDEIEQALALEYKRHDTNEDEPQRIMSFWFEIDDLEKRFQDAVGLKTFKFNIA